MSEEKLSDLIIKINRLENEMDTIIKKIMTNREISLTREKNDEDYIYECFDEKIERLKEDIKTIRRIKRKQREIESLKEKREEIIKGIERKRLREQKKKGRKENERKEH